METFIGQERLRKRKEEIKMKKTWKVFLTLVTALVAVVLVACV